MNNSKGLQNLPNIKSLSAEADRLYKGWNFTTNNYCNYKILRHRKMRFYNKKNPLAKKMVYGMT